METLKEGQKAPLISLLDDSGKTVTLKDFKGQKIVLYFYPKDDTPGCTTQACSFRDEWAEFKKRKIQILGVSPDSPEKHLKFKTKYKLPFPLLSDPEKDVLQRYGVWQEKSMYGRKYMGVVRTTVLIDEQGVITQIFPKVSVTGHTQEILAAI